MFTLVAIPFAFGYLVATGFEATVAAVLPVAYGLRLTFFSVA
jgi:hypothetical protein